MPLKRLEKSMGAAAPRRLKVSETGVELSVEGCVAAVSGLPYVRADELVEIRGSIGIAFSLLPGRVLVVMLDGAAISAGDKAVRTGRIADVPVGPELLGRAIGPLGSVIDGGRALRTKRRLPLERPARSIMERKGVDRPLITGIKAIDSVIPIGRGQRELILGDRQTGKTALAVDSIIAQKGNGVVCVYCAIGGRTDSVAKVKAGLEGAGAMDHTVIVAAAPESSPGLLYMAPYAAASIAEYFMEEEGRDVLVVYDSLSAHAEAYRQLSLYLRRPPGREAYPGDIFYVHSRLLERATQLRAGGSVTALPICETLAENVASYIPTNLISITDGQIFLSANLFGKGFLPAVNVGVSVSRVGARAQPPAIAQVAGDMKISYSQFAELENFSKFGSSVDDATKKALARGERVREFLRQPQGSPQGVAEQAASIAVLNSGALNDVPLVDVGRVLKSALAELKRGRKPMMDRLDKGGRFAPADLKMIGKLAENAKH